MVVANPSSMTHDIPRIDATRARARCQAGRALLVCAYDEQKGRGMRLEGAVTLDQFLRLKPTLNRHNDMIFYGVGPDDDAPVGLAGALRGEGFAVAVLEGGAHAWRHADYPLSPDAWRHATV
jgi:hypothetical protein